MYNDFQKTEENSPSNIFIAGVLVFVVFVCSFSLIVFSKTLLANDNRQSQVDEGNPIYNEEQDKNIEKILIIGIDQVEGQPSRSDVIILAIINKDESTVHLLSIPRDTRVAIDGHGIEKINHAQAYGGPALLTGTVSNFFKTDVSKYILLNYPGFEELVNILGGIEYYVEMRMYFPEEGIDLYSGLQHLDGDKALQYVRYRSDGRGDIGRVERQQKFLMALADQTLKIKNVLKIPELIAGSYRSVKTNMSVKEMVDLGLAMKNLNIDNLDTRTLPGEAKYINGVSYWVPEILSLDEIFEEEQLNDSETVVEQ